MITEHSPPHPIKKSPFASNSVDFGIYTNVSYTVEINKLSLVWNETGRVHRTQDTRARATPEDQLYVGQHADSTRPV